MHLAATQVWDREACGYVASGLVLATFATTSIRSLRLTAIASNVAFIVYALLVGLTPVLVLHSLLLPLNVYRLAQLEWPRRRVEDAVMSSRACEG